MKRKLLALTLAISTAAIANADELGSLPKNDLVHASHDQIMTAAIADAHAFYEDSKDSPYFKDELTDLNGAGRHHADVRGLILQEQNKSDYAAAFVAIVMDLATKR